MIRFKKVVNGFLIVHDDANDEFSKSSSGIITNVAGGAKAVSEGVVLQMDKGNELIKEMGIKEGDRILYSKFSAEDVVIRDEKGGLIPHVKTISVDSIQAIF